MKVYLSVNGKDFGGFENISIQNSLSQITGVFNFQSSNKYVNDLWKWNIKMGDFCEVKVDNEILITGYINNIDINYDKSNFTMNFSGRDVTGDLVDCSHTGKNEFEDLTIKNIILNLLEPFDIELVVVDYLDLEIDLAQIISNYAIDSGETVFDVISRLCLSVGALPISFGDGKLTIVRNSIKIATDSLVSGINILSASYNQSNDERYSQYIVKGTAQDTESAFGGSDNNQLYGVADDSIVTRYRPLIIIDSESDETSIKRCQTRAEWEKRLRAGQSRNVTYTIQGWQQSTGKLWRIHDLVFVKDDYLNINTQKLISNIFYDSSLQTGNIVRMNLVDPETFQPPAIPLATDIESVFDR